jgi:elongation factor G
VNVFPPEKIRNVALVGHAGVGKTTLAEALLYRAGTIKRLGTVEEGNTVTDFDPEEHARDMSLGLALAPFEWKGYKINLIDTPGYADFVGDVHAALRVADLAVFVVDAAEGVEVQTEYAWEVASKLGVPRMTFINKLDKERASFDRTLADLQDRFGAGIAPIELPIGEHAAFHGVADLFRDKAYVYDSGQAEEVDIPEEIADREHEIHDNLVEGIVVADDDMLEAYLEGEVPSVEELEKTMAIGIADATVFPVVLGSATGPIAVDRLADFIVELGPAPTDRPPIMLEVGDELIEVESDASGDPLAFVFKTIADPYVGQISLLRVRSGTLKPDLTISNSRSGSDEKLAKLATMIGKETELVDSAPAGDIVAVAKLNDTATGDTLTLKNKPVKLPPLERPTPVLATALIAKTQADEDKLATALRRVLAEDPALELELNPETKQTLLKGMGETHLLITIERLERKFGVGVETEPVKVPYRETVSRSAEAEGKYKKQTGGHGQYGVALIALAPTQRGDGFEFVDAIKGGSIPRQFIPAVEKGIAETMADGGIRGFPIVDIQVKLVDGKYHSVDSSEMSFKQAGKLALKSAMQQAGPVLLEPISKIEVTVPPDYQGDVMGDLSSRRGQLQGTIATTSGQQQITALVPTSEILSYAIDLRSITQGWGRFESEHDHYQEVPSHMADQIKADDDD